MGTRKGTGASELRRTFRALLACGHRPQFTMNCPTKGDIITCYMCRNGQLVIGTKALCWAYQCETCHLRRTYGHSKLTTVHAAQAHAERNNHTTVVLNLDEQVVDRYTGEGEQLTLGI